MTIGSSWLGWLDVLDCDRGDFRCWHDISNYLFMLVLNFILVSLMGAWCEYGSYQHKACWETLINYCDYISNMGPRVITQHIYIMPMVGDHLVYLQTLPMSYVFGPSRKWDLYGPTCCPNELNTDQMANRPSWIKLKDYRSDFFCFTMIYDLSDFIHNNNTIITLIQLQLFHLFLLYSSIKLLVRKYSEDLKQENIMIKFIIHWAEAPGEVQLTVPILYKSISKQLKNHSSITKLIYEAR